MPSNTNGLHSNEVLKDEINSLDTKYAKLEHSHDELVTKGSKMFYFNSEQTKNEGEETYDEMFKRVLKEICNKFPNHFSCTFISRVQPDIQGIALIFIYNTSEFNSAGLSRYASITFFPLGATQNIYRYSSWEEKWETRLL